jgi:hypothetical protein
MLDSKRLHKDNPLAETVPESYDVALWIGPWHMRLDHHNKQRAAFVNRKIESEQHRAAHHSASADFRGWPQECNHNNRWPPSSWLVR